MNNYEALHDRDEHTWNLKFLNDIKEYKAIWDSSSKCTPLQTKCWNDLSKTYNTSVDILKLRLFNLRKSFRRQLAKIPRNGTKFAINPRMFECTWPYYKAMLFLVTESGKKPNIKRNFDVEIDNPVVSAKKVKPNVAVNSQKAIPNFPAFNSERNATSKTNNGINSVAVLQRGIKSSQTKLNVRADSPVVTPKKVHIDMAQDANSNDESSTEVACDIPTTKDSVYHFLMGLLEPMKQLDPVQKLNVQTAFYNILRQELAK